MTIANPPFQDVGQSAGGLRLDATMLDSLMPMYLSADASGCITGLGPTLRALLQDAGTEPVGASLFDFFEVRRPRAAVTIDPLIKAAGGRIKVTLLGAKPLSLKGLAVPQPHGGGILINFSLGISVLDAVQNFQLTAADFAHTDLTIELLYLHEANTAAMADARRLTARLQNAHAAAEQRALTDALTGLKNRRAMDRILARIIEEGANFSLLHLDLDKFKEVNDTYGHAAGDEVLQTVGVRLANQVRGSDVVARIGGDEFVIILRNTTRPEQLSPAAERIVAGLERPIPHGGVDLSISCSIGIAQSTYYAEPKAEKMLHDADMALYKSKNDGRGRHSYISDVETSE